jgi:hypothetical protein
MIIECEFTNATDFSRERVVFLTGLQIMVDSGNLLYAVSWDESKCQPEASVGKLKRAMHDSEFRIHLDREGHFMTLARCLGVDWIVWFIGVDWRPRHKIYSSLCMLQRFFRRRVMLRLLSHGQIFSRAAAAHRLLLNRFHGNRDVVELIIQRFLFVSDDAKSMSSRIFPPDSPLQWIKPHGDGQIFA